MKTKKQANKDLLSKMLNKCVELKAMQNDLIECDYSFNSQATKVIDKIEWLEVSLMDCMNNLND